MKRKIFVCRIDKFKYLFQKTLVRKLTRQNSTNFLFVLNETIFIPAYLLVFIRLSSACVFESFKGLCFYLPLFLISLILYLDMSIIVFSLKIQW